MNNEDVYLVCWCKPLACHGDVIKRMVEDKLNIQVET